MPHPSEIIIDGESKGLSIRAAAKRVGVSEATLRKAIADGFIEVERNGKFAFLAHQTIVELHAGKIRQRAPSLGARAIERIRGETGKQVFERFERGMILTDIVQDLAVDPIEVNRLWEQWLMLQKRNEEVPRCHCRSEQCNRLLRAIGICEYHASRLVALTDEELAVVAEHRRKKRAMVRQNHEDAAQ